MVSDKNISKIKKAKDHFNKYLREKKFRRTPQREIILEEIYNMNGHFNADFLYNFLKSKSLKISKATVYNTVDLFVECDLIIKHQFGNSVAKYEKAFSNRQHDHIICIDCGKLIEFCDPRIQHIQSTMEELFDFEIKNHSLNFFGKCKKNSTQIPCDKK